jgi:hypothetical protein
MIREKDLVTDGDVPVPWISMINYPDYPYYPELVLELETWILTQKFSSSHCLPAKLSHQIPQIKFYLSHTRG